MGCCSSKEKSEFLENEKELYYRNLGGFMISYSACQDSPSREDESTFIADFDKSYMQPGDVMYIINSKWLSGWHAYIHGTGDRSKVGQIDNNNLYSFAGRVSLRKGLVVNHDYKPVCREVWEYYFQHYGGTPVIYFHVPSGFSEEEYKSGEWLHGVNLSELCDVIYPLPDRKKAPYQLASSRTKTHRLGDEDEDSVALSVIKTDEDLIAASRLSRNVGLNNIQEGEALTKKITTANVELIAMGMVQDQARHKFNEASGMDEDINKHNSMECEGEGDAAAVEVLVAQQLRLREEGAALRLQSAIRTRRAKRRVAALRAERKRLLEEGSALLIQSAWRIMQARHRMFLLKRDRQRATAVQALWRGKVARRVCLVMTEAVCCINRFMRGSLARGHFRILVRSHHPHTLVVRLHEASNVNIGDIDSSDPYVRVANLELMHPHAHATSREPFRCPIDMDRKLRVASQYKSRIVQSTLHPVWEEDAILPAVQLDSTLVLSVFDSDLVGKDDLLGQNSLGAGDMDARLLYGGRTISYDKTDIGDFVYPVHDATGKALVSSGDGQMKGKGKLCFSVRLSSLAYSMCGWIQKDMKTFLHKGYFNRWVVLHDFAITFYENPFRMNDPLGTLLCKDVVALSVKGNSFTLHCASEKNSWHMCFEEPAVNPSYNQMWLRKLIRSCPNIRDPPSMALLGLPPSLWDRSVDHITHGIAPPLRVAQSGYVHST